MPEELYARQQDLHLDVPQEVTVIGLGGIGFWVATYAAMSGVGTLYLFDPDILEETNRNRLPVCQSSINRPKVDVAADFIRSIRPDATVIPVKERLEGIFLDIQMSISNVFIDCTDSPKCQIQTFNACKKVGRRFIRAGYDGTRIMVTSNVSGWIKGDVEEEPYQVNPSWVVPAATVAALAVGKLIKYPAQEVGLDLSEIGVPTVQRQKRVTTRCRQAGRRQGA